jgi:quinolinate synthase
MKLTTLEKVRDSLVEGKHRITVEPELAERAHLAIERMVSIGG